jgi:hypothetical protein
MDSVVINYLKSQQRKCKEINEGYLKKVAVIATLKYIPSMVVFLISIVKDYHSLSELKSTYFSLPINHQIFLEKEK